MSRPQLCLWPPRLRPPSHFPASHSLVPFAAVLLTTPCPRPHPLTPPHLRALPKLPDSARVSDPDPVRPGAPCPCLSRCRSRALSPSPILTRRPVCPLHGLCLATIFASGFFPTLCHPPAERRPGGLGGCVGGWGVVCYGGQRRKSRRSKMNGGPCGPCGSAGGGRALSARETRPNLSPGVA